MSANTSERTLARRLDLGEVTSWRLHWLLCDLWTIQGDIKKAHCGQRVAQLHSGPFAEMLARVKRVEVSYERMQWETKTMLGLDYENEVKPLFTALPKNAEYAAELAKAKALLQVVVDRTLATEARQLQDSILLPHHALS